MGNTHGISPRVLSLSLFYTHIFSLFPPASAFVLLFLPLVLSILYVFLSFFLSHPSPAPSSNAIHRRRVRGERESTLLLLDFHSVDRSFAHNGYKVTRGWSSALLFLAKPTPPRRVAPYGAEPSRAASRRADGPALSPSSVINSVNDQIYSGQPVAG